MYWQVRGRVTAEGIGRSSATDVQAVGFGSCAGDSSRDGNVSALGAGPNHRQAQHGMKNCVLPHQSDECCHTWIPFVTDTWCDTRKSPSGKDLQLRRGRFGAATSRIANPVSPCAERMSRMSRMSRRLKIGIGQNVNQRPLHGGHADAHASVDAASRSASRERRAAEWNTLRPARQRGPAQTKTGPPERGPTQSWNRTPSGPLRGGHADAHASVDATSRRTSCARWAADWGALRPARKRGSPQAETGRRALGKDDWLQRSIDAALVSWDGAGALLSWLKPGAS
jgi:hypothetical protein